MPPPDNIIPLGGNRCLVIPDGEAALVNFADRQNIVVERMTPGCFVTIDGWPEKDYPARDYRGPGCWAERAHPFPLTPR